MRAGISSPRLLPLLAAGALALAACSPPQPASRRLALNGQADLEVGSSAPTNTAAGEPYDYEITVTNHGPDPAPSLKIVATLPAGVTFVSALGSGWTCTPGGGNVTCTFGLLPVDGSARIDMVLKAAALTSPATVTHSAKVSLTGAGTADANSLNDVATAMTSVRPVDLSLSKRDLVDPVAAGAAIGYAIVVQNPALAAAHGVMVSDTLPAGTSFVAASGDGWTCALAGNTLGCTRAVIEAAPLPTPPITVVLSAPASPGVITNTAVVSSSATDPASANNTATQQTTITAPAAGNAEVQVAAEHAPEQVLIGSPIDYTLKVRNNGPDPAMGVQVAAVLPGGASFVSAMGAGWTCAQANGVVTCFAAGALPVGWADAITVRINAPAPPGTATLTAVATAATADSSLANNVATTSATVIDPTSPNQPPTLTLPTSLSTLEDTDLILAGAAAPQVADPDAASEDLELLVTCTRGVLTLSSTSGLQILEGDGILDPVLRVRGSVAALNAALDASTFTPEPNVFGDATLSFSVDDLGHNGVGGARQASGALTIVITPVDDPPIAVADEASIPGNQTATIDVLGNDRAGEPEQALTVTAVGPALHGMVALVDGAVVYTPPRDFFGDDGFEYTISDGTSSATGSVVVHVGEPVDGPVVANLGGKGLGCSAAPGPTRGGAPGIVVLVLAALAACLRKRRCCAITST